MQRLVISGILCSILLVGCRGMESDNPPIHPNLNMDFQERFEAQEANPFFEDEAAMRTPPVGTVPRGMLREDTRFYAGLTEDGALVEEIPVRVTQELLERGQERYDIYCAVCHGRVGDGEGVIMTGGYGYTPVPSYHVERLREISDGYLYDVIANGIRNMPAYRHQIPVADRWAIVAYIRALQRSQYATGEDVPPSIVARVEQEGGNIEGGRTGPEAQEAGAAEDTSSTVQEEALADEAAPVDTASGAGSEPQDTAAQATETDTAEADTATTAMGDTAAAGAVASADATDTTATEAAEDTAASEAAPTSADAAAGAGGDTATGETAAAGNASAAGASGGSNLIWILLLVVLPATAMVVLLIAAFRKEREH